MYFQVKNTLNHNNHYTTKYSLRLNLTNSTMYLDWIGFFWFDSTNYYKISKISLAKSIFDLKQLKNLAWINF